MIAMGMLRGSSAGQCHLEVQRGGQDGNAFDTVVVEIRQRAVEAAFPVVSFRLRGFEMAPEERMLTCAHGRVTTFAGSIQNRSRCHG